MKVVEKNLDTLILSESPFPLVAAIGLGMMVALLNAYGTWKSGLWVACAVMLAITALIFFVGTLYIRFVRLRFSRPLQTLYLSVTTPISRHQREIPLRSVSGVMLQSFKNSPDFYKSLDRGKSPRLKTKPVTLYCIALTKSDGTPPEPLSDVAMPMSVVVNDVREINDWMHRAFPKRT